MAAPAYMSVIKLLDSAGWVLHGGFPENNIVFGEGPVKRRMSFGRPKSPGAFRVARTLFAEKGFDRSHPR